MKEYHFSKFDDKVVLTQDIERRGVDYINKDIHNAWKKRYILEVGSKVTDIFGNIVTIKEIIHHESTKTTNYLVEENSNIYNPWEFAGIYISEMSFEDFSEFICSQTVKTN